jgi:hypothetical protein
VSITEIKSLIIEHIIIVRVTSFHFNHRIKYQHFSLFLRLLFPFCPFSFYLMTIIMKDTMASPAPQRRVLAAAKYPRTKHQANSPMVSPGNRRRKDVGDYWLGKTLGRGSSGTPIKQ